MRQAAGLFLLTIALGFSGCSAPAASQPAPPTTTALSDLVWSSGHSLSQRKAGAKELLQRNPDLFFTQAKKNLLSLQHWPMLKYVLKVIVHSDKKDFTPLIIRSWARLDKTYSDTKRPERKALEKLYPDQTARRLLISAFSQGPGQAEGKIDLAPSLMTQTAAWAVLYRLLGPVQARAVLARAPAGSLLIDDLQRAAEVLDVLPHSSRTVLWLIYDLSVAKKMWNRAAKTVRSLSADQRRGLALGHIPALAHLRQAVIAIRPEALYSAVRKRLSVQAHQQRDGRVTDDFYSAALQKISVQNSALCWGDVVRIDELQNAMDKPAFLQRIFAQADADYQDKTSEHGGVITWLDGQLLPAAFAPAANGNDRRFIASKKLIENLYTGLAHYHFHVQKYTNGAWAGPGEGDLNFAWRFEIGAVVFTFINQNTLNVDYYQPGNVVIDLGMIKRQR